MYTLHSVLPTSCPPPSLLQDLFTWHPVTTILHLSWKNCTGFPFHNVLNIKSRVCFRAINGFNPAYLSELLHVYTPCHTLRSSSDIRMLKIQQYKHKTHGFCTFSCLGHIWNFLQDLWHCSALSSFKTKQNEVAAVYVQISVIHI